MPIDLQTAKIVVFLIFGLLIILGIIFGWFRRILQGVFALFKPSDMSKPYGEANMFPAIWPIAILLLSLCGELVLAGSPATSLHHAIDVTATIFTYGVAVFPVVSYFSFEWLVLPALNYLPRATNNDSYWFNCVIVLTLTEITFSILLLWKNPQGGIDLVATAAIPTGVVGLNCVGHYWFSKFKQPTPEKMQTIFFSLVALSMLSLVAVGYLLPLLK